MLARMRRTALPLLLLLPAVLSAQEPPPGPSAAAAGCWALALGPWSPAAALSPAYSPPPRMVLDTVRAPELPWEEALQVRPMPGVPPTRHDVAYWMPVGSDSVRVVWSTGFDGVALHLAVRGDTLRGRAVEFSDARDPEQPGPTAAAAAVRISCAPAAEAPATPVAPAEPQVAAPAEPVPEEGPAPGEAPPRGSAEEVAGWTIGGVMLWMLAHLVGIL